MLDPFYLQPPEGIEKEGDVKTYKVLAYAQIEQYVLIYWEIKLLQPIFTRTQGVGSVVVKGQSLWIGKKHIFSREGKSALTKPRQKIPTKGSPRKIVGNWLEEVTKEGQAYYGLPKAIALKLEDPNSLRYL